MKHLRSFDPLHESATSPKLLGFVLEWDGLLYPGADSTFRGFSQRIVDHFSFAEDDTAPLDFDSLREALSEMDEEAGSAVFDACTLWWGLIPRKSNPFFTQTGGINPYATVRDLEDLFTNSAEIFKAHPTGNGYELGYLSQSIENDPSQLEAYHAFLSEEDFDLVTKEIKSMGDTELKGLIAYYRAKSLL